MIRIYFNDEECPEYEISNKITGLSLKQKLMILGRLEEVKADVLENLYNNKEDKLAVIRV